MIKQRGFTLIELLVVIAIIGILSSVVIASLNSARVKGRDARREGDIDALKKALVLYQDDNGGAYPSTSGATTTLDGSDSVSSALLSGNYIPTIPVDPQSPTDSYSYNSADGTSYTLNFCMEQANNGFTADCNNYYTPQ
jgi:type IV pilus assembly protein PilA